MAVHFALVDHAALVLVDELDRILDRNDVVAAGAIHIVDHRRERRRFAGAGGAGDEDQPLLELAQSENRRRELELFGGGYLGGYPAEDGAHALPVEKDVAAEPGEPGNLVSEVRIVALLELDAVLARHDRLDELDDVFRG